MTTVSIQHPTGDIETIRARPTDDPQRFELRAHSFLLPLGPGDVVRVDDTQRVVEVISLEPQWIYMVDLHLPSDYLAGPLPGQHPARRVTERLIEEWKRDTTVTEMHGFAMLVSATSERWFMEKVRTNRYVEHCEQVRTPQLREVAIPHEQL